MIKIIPKGTGFFENYDRTFGKKTVLETQKKEENEISGSEKKYSPTEKLESKESEQKTEQEYITRKEFEEFKSKLLNILILERGLILTTVRLMDQAAIASERIDTVNNIFTHEDSETLISDSEICLRNINNQYEVFDDFNKTIKEQLGI
jgi:hypothetical protein